MTSISKPRGSRARAARWRGVVPMQSETLTSAPARIKAETASWLLALAAQCRGVRLQESRWLTSDLCEGLASKLGRGVDRMFRTALWRSEKSKRFMEWVSGNRRRSSRRSDVVQVPLESKIPDQAVWATDLQHRAE